MTRDMKVRTVDPIRQVALDRMLPRYAERENTNRRLRKAEDDHRT
jgi:hypothetical protein